MSLSKFIAGSALAASVSFFGILASCSDPEPAVVDLPRTNIVCETSWAEMISRRQVGWRILTLDEDQTKKIVAGVNATPPRSDFEAEEIHIARHNGSDLWLAYFVTAGCVTHVVSFPTYMLEALLRGEAGEEQGDEL